jgi:hypothetical protein
MPAPLVIEIVIEARRQPGSTPLGILFRLAVVVRPS